MNDSFHKISSKVSSIAGSPMTFVVAVLIIVIWAFSGSIFNYSDTWQLVINTGTTIVTFLMVFLIQNTQNRDAKAIHLKLDELLKGVVGARTSLVDIEDLPDDQLETLRKEFQDMHVKYSSELLKRGKSIKQIEEKTTETKA